MDREKDVLSIITKEQRKMIDKTIKSGNSVEIHPAKDGVKVYEVRKQTIK